MKTSLRYVLIGCGRIAQRHAEQMERTGHLVAVCDIDPNQYLSFVKKYNCRGYEKLDDLLRNEKDKADIAVICTPNGLHADQSIACLENGWHVLCEKPMAINMQSAQEMILAAKKAEKKLFVVKQNRYNPPVVVVKKLMEEGKLGKIVGIQLNCFWNRNKAYYNNAWKGTKEMDGGILFTQFSHFIDLVYWLVGDIRTLKAFSKNLLLRDYLIEFEDNCVVIAEFYNGAIGTMHFTISSYKKNMEGSITIFGETGTIKIGGQYLNKLEYQCIEDEEEIIVPISNLSNNYGFYEGSMSNHDKVYDVLEKSLAYNETKLLVSAEEGFKTVEIIERIYNTIKLLQTK